MKRPFIRRKSQGRLHRFYFLLWEGPSSWADNERWTALARWEKCAQPVLWLLCKLLGHQPIDDQCMMPEHRYCVWCHVRQAYKETI